MIVEVMLERLRLRTKKRDEYFLLGELNAAKDWAWNRIFLLNKDLLITHDTEVTPSTTAVTRNYDLAANVTGVLYAIKMLWVRFSSETDFTPARFADSSDAVFAYYDRFQTDSTESATNHPVFVDVRNFDQIRFAPPLPANAEVRVDFIRRPPDFSLDTNADIDAGDDVPEPTHEAIVDKATGQIFNLLDDDRTGFWETQAESKLVTAMNVLRDRQLATPERTKPYRRRARRWI